MCYEHATHGHHGMSCWRQFLTKGEKIEMLEAYQKRLERETQGVKETIEQLKKAS